jgi:tetratricopeptide (TPR) repeat protein
VYYLQGRYTDALREYELEHDFLQSTDHALRERALIELAQKIGAAKLRQGDREAAEKWFARAIKAYDERTASGAFDSSTAYYMALVYALRGDADRALKLLNDAMEQHREFNVMRAHFDPDLDGVRDDPRFAEIARVPE